MKGRTHHREQVRFRAGNIASTQEDNETLTNHRIRTMGKTWGLRETSRKLTRGNTIEIYYSDRMCVTLTMNEKRGTDIQATVNPLE